MCSELQHVWLTKKFLHLDSFVPRHTRLSISISDLKFEPFAGKCVD